MCGFVVFDEAFRAAIDEIQALDENNNKEEALTRARQLLKDDALPQYHRLLTLIWIGKYKNRTRLSESPKGATQLVTNALLATLAPWHEASEARKEAKIEYRLAKLLHPTGNEVDDLMFQEARDSLDGLVPVLVLKRQLHQLLNMLYGPRCRTLPSPAWRLESDNGIPRLQIGSKTSRRRKNTWPGGSRQPCPQSALSGDSENDPW